MSAIEVANLRTNLLLQAEPQHTLWICYPTVNEQFPFVLMTPEGPNFRIYVIRVCADGRLMLTDDTMDKAQSWIAPDVLYEIATLQIDGTLPSIGEFFTIVGEFDERTNKFIYFDVSPEHGERVRTI